VEILECQFRCYPAGQKSICSFTASKRWGQTVLVVTVEGDGAKEEILAMVQAGGI
jgi:hypothetical protein